ncbi:MAG: pyridoxamine 5'-phosphate oxidase family protein [bacterium]|nr:pyridoxamine 5'-phosphate oxidase family protein [bacterium]
MKKVISIIKKSQAAYLATIDAEGKPEIRALLNLTNPKKYKSLDGKALIAEGETLTMYFTTNTSSNKVQRIRNNPHAALYFCEPESFQGICASGVIEEVADQKVKEAFWQKEWLIYYPKGKTDPDYALLKFTSTKLEGWYGFGKHVFGETK